jgi:hypothetical protein
LKIERLQRLSDLSRTGPGPKSPVFDHPFLSIHRFRSWRLQDRFQYLPAQTSSSGEGAIPAQEDKPESGMLVSANTSVDGESFPELLFAVQDVAWPPVADNNCGRPSAPDQNHSDVTCTGLTVQIQSSGDHAGIQDSPPAGNLITIQFQLTLASSGTVSNSAKQ